MSGPTVLFLDDDPDILAAAKLVVERGGFTFSGLETPAAARARLAEGDVDLLLLDLNFRRGDTSGEAGLAFLEEILAATPDLPVVVVTGHSGAFSRRRSPGTRRPMNCLADSVP